jgi:hypothetical protein
LHILSNRWLVPGELVGLSNGVFLFSMARPWLVVRAMAVALGVSLAVGITLSRTHAYWWSAAGTPAGASCSRC